MFRELSLGREESLRVGLSGIDREIDRENERRFGGIACCSREKVANESPAGMGLGVALLEAAEGEAR